MANATQVTLGQANSSGTDREIFIEQWLGWVLKAFTVNTIARDKHLTQSVGFGKSHTFDEVGVVSARKHTIGAEILGQAVTHGQRRLTPEDLIIADVFLPLVSDSLNHYETMGKYGERAGEALAERYDRDVYRNFIAAARETASSPALATVSGRFVKDGSVSTSSDGDLTTAVGIIEQGLTAAQNFDDTFVVDRDDRNMFIRPLEYYLLLSAGITDNLIMHRDLGGEGSVAKGMVGKIANVNVIKSVQLNALAGVDESSSPVDTDTDAAYALDLSDTIGVVATPEAAGSVEVLGITPEMDWDTRRQGTLILSKMLKGTGVVRPECARELTNV